MAFVVCKVAGFGTVVRYWTRVGSANGAPLTFPELLAACPGLSPKTMDAVRLLAPGETFHGSAPDGSALVVTKLGAEGGRS